jgi:hypothetical protein
MKLAPGSLAKLDGEQPVTILAQTETRTFYIPGYHFHGCAATERFTAAERQEMP